MLLTLSSLWQMMAMEVDAPVIAKVADFGLAQQTPLGVTQRLETWQWVRRDYAQ